MPVHAFNCSVEHFLVERGSVRNSLFSSPRSSPNSLRSVSLKMITALARSSSSLRSRICHIAYCNFTVCLEALILLTSDRTQCVFLKISVIDFEILIDAEQRCKKYNLCRGCSWMRGSEEQESVLSYMFQFHRHVLYTQHTSRLIILCDKILDNLTGCIISWK